MDEKFSIVDTVPSGQRTLRKITGLSGRAAWLMICLWVAVGAIDVGFMMGSPQFLLLLLVQWLAYRTLMLLQSRNAKRGVLLVSNAMVLGVVLGFMVFVRFYMGSTMYQRIETPLWERRTMLDSIERLNEADQPEQLPSKVGRGRFFKFRDGSWLALRYNDTHSFHFGTSGVTRDSDGKWLAGNHHFCGVLAEVNFLRLVERHRSWREELAQTADPELKEMYQALIEGSKREAGLLKLDEAADAATARQILIDDFGFREFETP